MLLLRLFIYFCFLFIVLFYMLEKKLCFTLVIIMFEIVLFNICLWFVHYLYFSAFCLLIWTYNYEIMSVCLVHAFGILYMWEPTCCWVWYCNVHLKQLKVNKLFNIVRNEVTSKLQNKRVCDLGNWLNSKCEVRNRFHMHEKL